MCRILFNHPPLTLGCVLHYFRQPSGRTSGGEIFSLHTQTPCTTRSQVLDYTQFAEGNHLKAELSTYNCHAATTQAIQSLPSEVVLFAFRTRHLDIWPVLCSIFVAI